MRRLRYLPDSGLVEVTCRTQQGRYLLKPGTTARAVVLGELGRALAESKVKLHDYVVLSNHLHLLVSAEHYRQISYFLARFLSNLSKEMGRLHGWSGAMFHGRNSPVPVSGEPEAQIARLRYLLSQGVKEGLVGSRRDWPGAHGTKTLLGEGPEYGDWLDRTAWGDACRDRKNPPGAEAFTVRYPIPLAPLPCWADLSEPERVVKIKALLSMVEEEARTRHEIEETKPAGVAVVIAMDPHFLPPVFVQRPAPWSHTASKAVRQTMMEAYRTFEAAFRQAVEAVRKGERNVVFPEDSFPPPILLRGSWRPVHPGYG